MGRRLSASPLPCSRTSSGSLTWEQVAWPPPEEGDPWKGEEDLAEDDLKHWLLCFSSRAPARPTPAKQTGTEGRQSSMEKKLSPKGREIPAARHWMATATAEPMRHVPSLPSKEVDTAGGENKWHPIRKARTLEISPGSARTPQQGRGWDDFILVDSRQPATSWSQGDRTELPVTRTPSDPLACKFLEEAREEEARERIFKLTEETRERLARLAANNPSVPSTQQSLGADAIRPALSALSLGADGRQWDWKHRASMDTVSTSASLSGYTDSRTSYSGATSSGQHSIAPSSCLSLEGRESLDSGSPTNQPSMHCWELEFTLRGLMEEMERDGKEKDCTRGQALRHVRRLLS